MMQNQGYFPERVGAVSAMKAMCRNSANV